MKWSVIFVIFLFTIRGFSQPYGNEWIAPSYAQKYLKIQVAEDGIYRIDYNTLNTALSGLGESVSLINHNTFQIFGRGEEQHIYLDPGNDGVFNAGDYIEFYGRKNDGWLDSLLYDTPSSQSNPFYSLINDTAVYFLTWKSSGAGLRMGLSTNTNFSGLTPSAFCLKEALAFNPETYLYGKLNQNGKPEPAYVAGKGWFKRFGYPNASSSATLAVNTQNPYTGAGAPDVTVRTVVSGASDDPDTDPDHHLIIRYGSSSPAIPLHNSTFKGYQLLKLDFMIPSGNLQNGNTFFRFEYGSLSPSPASSYFGASHVYVKYPRTYDMNNAQSIEITVPDGDGYLEFSNINTSSDVWLYDLTHHYKVTVVSSGSDFQALLPNSNGEKKCLIVSEDQINNVTNLKPVSSNGQFTDYLSLQRDSAFLIITHNLLLPEISNYRNYRNSTGHNPVVAEVSQLYDQFAAGINKHPEAIRRFCQYLLDNWSSPPQHLFLIGKGIASELCRKNSGIFAQNLLPQYSYPAGDGIYTAFMSSTWYEPAIPTGRLAARSPGAVSNYLRKVQEYENNKYLPQTYEDKEWMKTVIHFGGGSSATEQQWFKNFLNNYRNTIESIHFGGKVHSFFKTTSSPIQTGISDSTTKLINNGVSIMTFFGHAAGNSFDLSIGKPDDYTNSNGKYPLMIANSCNTGNIFQIVNSNTLSISEEFVLAEKGAIGFISTVSLGYATVLNSYTDRLYTQIGKENYGKSIGSSIKKSIIGMQDLSGQNFLNRSTCLEMTFHGDPALVINAHKLPDYAVRRKDVFFTPKYISAEQDSFETNILLSNLGKAINDSLTVELTRILGDGTQETFFQVVPAVYYKDTVTFKLWLNQEKGTGLNQFKIRADPYHFIDELTTLNNNLTAPPVELWISSRDLIPVFPHNFAVVPDKDITLKASTADPFAPARDYVIQIDTSDQYNSTKMRELITNSSGGVVEWDIGPSYFDFPLSDSMVYYWRCSPHSIDTSELSWRESSFQIIENKAGWGQAHPWQFKNDDYYIIRFNRSSPHFRFTPWTRELRCDVSSENSAGTNYRIDGVIGDHYFCFGTSAIHVAVIDSTTLEPWKAYHATYNPDPAMNFGQGNYPNGCGNRDRADKYFVFRTGQPAEMDSLAAMLNKIPQGHYILAYTGIKGDFQDTNKWKNSHFQAFEDLGATQIRTVGSDIPYIFFAKKGYPSSKMEVAGAADTSYISLITNIITDLPFGTISSPVIGPAKSWGSLHWRQFPLETPSADSVSLMLYGVDLTGQESLITSFPYNTTDVPNLSDYVNAASYPFIKMKFYGKDETEQSSPQLNRWQVLYEGVPEAALNAALAYSFHGDTVQQGDQLRFSTAVQNIGRYDMDSLRIHYWVEDHLRNIHRIDYPRQKALKPGEVISDEVSYNTKSLRGFNSFWVEVNPKDSLWQLEQHHFNNVARLGFYVKPDKTNPIMDVTFDGIHILDGDIVSPEPGIVIQVKDENLFLAMDDTSDFAIYITDPEGLKSRIYFTSSNGEEKMKFTPAVLPDNRAKIEYHPAFKTDGTYELMVIAQDASKNLAGKYDYTISFEVINQSTITEVLNYPNPFSTSTRFVFTLTGSEIPDYFRIQILTVTGKVIREITQEELGRINIGRNISDYAWDGRDEFGDPLGNGIYLYRVITKINGESIEHRSTNADRFFHKGFGKMYLMR